MMKTTEVLVKVTVWVQVGRSIGTGVLFDNPADADYLYVFTAKHCIYGDSFEEKVSPNDVLIKHRVHQEDEFQEFPVEKVLSSENLHDFSVLICKKGHLSGYFHDIPTIYFLKDDPRRIPEDLVYMGFPFAANNNYFIAGEAKFVSYDGELKFRMKSLLDLDTHQAPAKYNAKGFSGGGVFAIKDNNLVYCGMIQKILAYSNLICCNVPQLVNKLLKEEGRPIFPDDKSREARKLEGWFESLANLPDSRQDRLTLYSIFRIQNLVMAGIVILIPAMAFLILQNIAVQEEHGREQVEQNAMPLNSGRSEQENLIVPPDSKCTNEERAMIWISTLNSRDLPGQPDSIWREGQFINFKSSGSGSSADVQEWIIQAKREALAKVAKYLLEHPELSSKDGRLLFCEGDEVTPTNLRRGRQSIILYFKIKP